MPLLLHQLFLLELEPQQTYFEKRIEEFLQARSLALKSQQAYQQDLQRFLNWTEQSWAEVTPKQVALFKRYLMRSDPETGKRIL